MEKAYGEICRYDNQKIKGLTPVRISLLMTLSLLHLCQSEVFLISVTPPKPVTVENNMGLAA